MTTTPLDAGQVVGFVLLDITIILIAARAVGWAFTRIGQPRVVGEIVAGILLGPSLLGATVFTWGDPPVWLNCDQAVAGTDLVPSITTCLFPPQSQSVLGVIGQLALVFFMFLVGLELNFDQLKGKEKGIGAVSFGAVAAPIAIAFAIGPVLFGNDALLGVSAEGEQLAFTLWVAGMLVVTAFPVMARILQEKNLISSDMGATGVAAAAVVTILMFLTVAVADGVTKGASTTDLVVKCVVALVFVALMFTVGRRLLEPLGRRHEETGQLTAPMFAVIFIVLFGSAYAANQLGINVIVGGFLAGAIMPARTSLFRELSARLADLTGIVLLPIFLAFSGLKTDFTTLSWAVVVPIILFVVAAVVSKWAGGAVFAKVGGLSWAEGNVIGILMNCRGLLVLVVGLLAFNSGIISPSMQVAGVVMALATTMMTGPLFDWAAKKLPPAEPAVPPKPADAYRVLALMPGTGDAPEVARQAFERAGGRPHAEVVLVRLVTVEDHELVSATGSSVAEVERALRSMRLLRSFAPDDVEVTPLAYPTADPDAEVARLAEERGADLIVVPSPDDAAALGGIDVEVVVIEPEPAR